MDTSDSTLTVPKFPVSVDLAQVGMAPRRVRVFVAEHQASSFRRQRVVDLLELEEAFFPVEGDGEVFLVNKATVLWIGIPLDDGELPVEETKALSEGVQEGLLYDDAVQVTVSLSTGEVLSGEFLYSMPPGHGRPADYLNQGGHFARLWTQDEVFLINKSHVREVRDTRADQGEQ